MTARATASQLAGLPDMPADKSGVIRRAEREGWSFTEEPGRGGKRRLYDVAQLPAATRAALAWSQPAVVVPGAAPSPAESAGRSEGARLALRGGLEQRAAAARQQTSLRQAGELSPNAQARMDARLAVVRAFEAYSKASGLPVHQARIAFSLGYNDGSIEVPASVRTEIPSTSDSSIERWQQLLRREGITALAGAYGNRAGSGRIDRQPALAEFAQAMLVQYPHARATHVMRAMQARFGGDGPGPRAVLPSMRSLERWMADWRHAHAEVAMALANPDAWKNRHMVAFGSASEGITALNQLWELDSSPADVMLLDGRHSLIGGIDVGCRWPRLVVAKTSKATAVAALIRRMLLDLGVPERVKTDNGADYTSNHVRRVFAGLSPDGSDIQELCPPFQPWHKPHIERFFGTFTRDLVELLAGFIGHNVAERSAIEARKSFADRLMTRGEVVEINMTAADLQAFCDRWIDDVYMHRPHDGLGITPFEAAARQVGERRRIDDEHVLDILLAEAPGNNGRRAVGKKGIRLDEAHFIAPELEAWVGREVLVRYDAIRHDLGTIHVFDADTGRFVCLAQAPERTGIDRRDVAVKAKSLQTKRVQDERRALKAAARKVGTDQIVDEILRDRAAAAGKLTALPGRVVPHSAAGVSAAAAAAAAATAPRRTTADLANLADVQAAQSRIAATQVPSGQANPLADARAKRLGGVITPTFESPAGRVQWLLGQGHVRELSTEEQDCLARYRQEQPSSYRRLAALVDEQRAATADAKEKAPGRKSTGASNT